MTIRALQHRSITIAALFVIRGKPITLSRIARALRARLLDREPLNSCRGVYSTFADAARAAPRTKPLGYDSADSANWYLGKLNTLQLEDYPVVFWLKAALENSHSIFEVGGHIGEAYYAFSRLLAYPPDLSWTICDVPSVAAAGQALAKERGKENLRFVTQPEHSDGADVFLACGALQYLEQSPADMISAFRIRPKHVLINTTPIYDGPAFVTLQNIGSVYCAYRIFNREQLTRSIESLGYSLVDSWHKDRHFRIPKHPERSFDHYTGMYFRAK